jgi:hypothetical protein
MINKIILGVSVAVLIIVGLVAYSLSTRSEVTVGAAGGMLIENYIPAILYNDGYKSEREIVLSGANGDLTTGDDLTVADDVTIGGGLLNLTTTNTGTSTLIVGCLQFYATSTATAHKFQASTTPGIMYSQYGTCPSN